MELRHLRSFLALSEELHFRRAAQRLGLSQPALSQQIRALEQELGVPLFVRSRRSVALSDAGALLAARSRPLVDQLRNVSEEVRQLGARRQRLRLGYLEYINPPFISSALRQLRREHPEVVVERRDLWSAEVLSSLVNGTLDIGLAFIPIVHPALAFRPLFQGRWSVVVQKKHRFAARETVDVRELKGQPLILFERSLNPPLHDWLVDRFEESGFTPELAYATTQPSVGVELAAEGVGCFISASYVFRSLPRNVVARPLSGFDATLKMGVVWHSENRTPAVRSFLEILKEVSESSAAPLPAAGSP